MGQKAKSVETVYGNLTVLHRLEEYDHHHAYWLCRCICGKEIPVSGGALRRRSRSSCGCSQRYYRLRPYESLYNWLRTRSSKAGKYDGITYEEFLEFIAVGTCFYCNEELKWEEHSYRIKGNSNVNLDRIDSSKGYSKENCVPCCWECNTIKSDLDQDIFLSRVAKIRAYQETKKGLNE